MTRHAKAGTDPHVPRDVDAKLGRALLAGRSVLLLGHAASGKSRTAAEAVVRHLPPAGLLWPKARPQALRSLLDLDAQDKLTDGRLLVWLDDLAH